MDTWTAGASSLSILSSRPFRSEAGGARLGRIGATGTGAGPVSPPFIGVRGDTSPAPSGGGSTPASGGGRDAASGSMRGGRSGGGGGEVRDASTPCGSAGGGGRGVSRGRGGGTGDPTMGDGSPDRTWSRPPVRSAGSGGSVLSRFARGSGPDANPSRGTGGGADDRGGEDAVVPCSSRSGTVDGSGERVGGVSGVPSLVRRERSGTGATVGRGGRGSGTSDARLSPTSAESASPGVARPASGVPESPLPASRNPVGRTSRAARSAPVRAAGHGANTGRRRGRIASTGSFPLARRRLRKLTRREG